jgi:hypothetical protein
VVGVKTTHLHRLVEHELYLGHMAELLHGDAGALRGYGLLPITCYLNTQLYHNHSSLDPCRCIYPSP